MKLRVALIADQGREEDAAWRWLAAREGMRAQRYGTSQASAALADSDVIWMHATAPLPLTEPQRFEAFASQGGGLLLTLRAAELVAQLHLESSAPNDCRQAVWRHEADEWWLPELRSMSAYPRVRGLATYGPHPLVVGLHNGTYCWAPSEDEPYAWACYSGGARPVEGHVVGVERAYIVQNADRIVAWEYEAGRGRVSCLGAFTYFAAPDPLLRRQLETLVTNALRCVAHGGDGAARTHWPLPRTRAASSEALLLPEPLDLAGGLPDPAADPIAIAAPVAEDEPWDLAGRRQLVVGREASGIREVWTHPHRTVAAWDVRADGESARGVELTVSPDAVHRVLRAGDRCVEETTFVALEHPVAVVEYRSLRARRDPEREPLALELRLTVDLRRAWPFAAGCGGNLRFRQSAEGRAVLIDSESGDGVTAIFTSRAVAIALEPLEERGSGVLCRVTASLDAPFRVAVVGGTDRDDFDRNLRTIRRLGVDGLVRQRLERASTVRESRIAVTSGDVQFDHALEWAKRRLDAFVAETPGVGRSLLAGHAASTPGWGDGRPGYAWYFGRDACWAAFGLLAAGEFSLVRQVLRFLADRQDVTGKVLHEATTSGQFHYDAADSTPLFLLLVARYLAWTGETAFVASIWPKVERAYEFCVATDSDGDGLIENARVGHGWIESGPLGGARVTLYLAAIWRAALEGLARVAEALGNPRMQAECSARAARAGTAIEGLFYDPERRTYALDLRAGGTCTWRDTALLAVPLLLRAVNPLHAKQFLEELAGESFSAPWGVRMLPADDPLFLPSGYHQGAVWPLFTGWAALAEYATGRGEAGFTHLRANALLAFARQKGAFDEVLHGLEEKAAGVCGNQAWSASMVIQPLVEGLLGVEPDAPFERLVIAPQLPADWNSLDVAGVRCGATTYDLRLRRRGRDLSIGIRRVAGPPLWVCLAPRLEAVPVSVLLDDHAVRASLTAWGDGVRAAVSFQATAKHDLRVALG